MSDSSLNDISASWRTRGKGTRCIRDEGFADVDVFSSYSESGECEEMLEVRVLLNQKNAESLMKCFSQSLGSLDACAARSALEHKYKGVPRTDVASANNDDVR